MNTVSALVFRKNFGKILDRVVKKKEAILVKRMNEPIVVMEPYEAYLAGRADSSRQMQVLRAAEQIRKWAQRNAPKLKGIKAAEAIRRMRDERCGS